MDIKRSKSKLRRWIFTITLVLIALVIVVGISLGLTRLRPATPTLERSTLVVDTVKRGEMLREVSGSGTLAPQLTRWVSASTEGRVEKVLVQPGAKVTANTVIAELSNPQIEQQSTDAEFQIKATEADEENLRVKALGDAKAEESSVSSIRADYSQAKLQLDVDETLAKQGLVAQLNLKLSRVHVQDLADRLKIEEDRLEIANKSAIAQINAQESRLQQQRALAKLRGDQLSNLKVLAGTAGVVQEVSVQVGQQVTAGLNVARVADPASLKAQLKIPEAQITDVKLGQPVRIDTHNGIIKGTVSRIDPSAHDGTFVVDAELAGNLPSSARADLSVDGTIEIERLNNILFISRPAFGQAEQTVSMFRLASDGSNASRVQVSLGRISVSTVEILSGLEEGDQVILSDTSTVDDATTVSIH